MFNSLKYFKMSLYLWWRSLIDDPGYTTDDVVCVTTRPFIPNSIRLKVLYTPQGMSDAEIEFLKEVFEYNVIKVGGFGGVYRADKTCVAHEDDAIQMYGTHRPFCVISEQPHRRLERGLNDIANKYIVGKSYKELDAFGMNIGMLAYEVDANDDQVIEAWEIPTLYWSRSDMDGRHDPRLIYLDLLGVVTNGAEALAKAKSHHSFYASDITE